MCDLHDYEFYIYGGFSGVKIEFHSPVYIWELWPHKVAGHHPGFWSERDPDRTTAPSYPPEDWRGLVRSWASSLVFISLGHSSECCLGKSIQAAVVMTCRRQ